MRRFAALCLIALATQASAGHAFAGPAEESYLALRDGYIKTFSAAPAEDKEIIKQHDAALERLTSALKSIVGPVTPKGVPAKASSNVDTLFEGDSGYGHLDGLAFATAGDKLRVVVTTASLAQHWLGERKKDGMSQEIAAAARSESFYTSAVYDSAYAKYAELPVAKPANAKLAVAVLGVRGNGELKGTPSEIDITVVQGEPVFVVVADISLKAAPIPACERVYKQWTAKPVDEKDQNGEMAREDRALAAFTECYAKAAPSQPWFATATAKAQALVNQLPPGT
jgi:hypothetical protein